MNAKIKVGGSCSLAGILALVIASPSSLRLSDEALTKIAEFEGCEYAAYQCSANRWTAGIGHAVGIEQGMVLTDKQVADYYIADLEDAEKTVSRLVTAEVTQGQFDALTSFVFNVGSGNFGRSTLLRRINANDPNACDELLRWMFVSGKDCRLPESNCRGIVERRHWEHKQCKA